MSNHHRIYVTPSHTKKIFRNMKKVGKDFSGRVTPLFPTMMVQAQEEMGEESVVDEAINEKMDDRLVRATTIASSLEAKQDSSNIAKTQSKVTPNESSSYGADSGGGPRCQEAIGDAVAQTRSKRVSKISNDLLLSGGCCLEATKTTQAQEIDSLKRRVKKLEKKQRSRTHKLKRLYKVGLSARVESSDDKDITLTNDQEMFDVDKDLQGEEVVVEQKNKTAISSKKSHDKGKAKMIKELMKLKKKDQILFDEEIARKLQKEIYEEEILVGERSRQEEEANISLIETWEDIQAKVDVDYQLAERMQAEEQQELNEEEKAKLFMELLEKRRKFFCG
nr:hypothetical protein [Tanacetum cinerariifolium]